MPGDGGQRQEAGDQDGGLQEQGGTAAPRTMSIGDNAPYSTLGDTTFTDALLPLPQNR